MAGIVFVFLVLLITSFFGKRGIFEIFQVKNEREVLLKDKVRLEKEKSRLEREIKELENNPNAVEETAREKLWMLKPEEVVIIKENKPNSKLNETHPNKK